MGRGWGLSTPWLGLLLLALLDLPRAVAGAEGNDSADPHLRGRQHVGVCLVPLPIRKARRG